MNYYYKYYPKSKWIKLTLYVNCLKGNVPPICLAKWQFPALHDATWSLLCCHHAWCEDRVPGQQNLVSTNYQYHEPNIMVLQERENMHLHPLRKREQNESWHETSCRDWHSYRDCCWLAGGCFNESLYCSESLHCSLKMKVELTKRTNTLTRQQLFLKLISFYIYILQNYLIHFWTGLCMQHKLRELLSWWWVHLSLYTGQLCASWSRFSPTW